MYSTFSHRHYPAVAVVQYPAVYGRKAGSVEADSLDFVSFRQLRYQRTGDSSGTGLFPHGGIYKYKSAHILIPILQPRRFHEAVTASGTGQVTPVS